MEIIYCICLLYEKEDKYVYRYVFPRANSRQEAISKSAAFIKEEGYVAIELFCSVPYQLNRLSQDILDKFLIEKNFDGYVVGLRTYHDDKYNFQKNLNGYLTGWMEALLYR